MQCYIANVIRVLMIFAREVELWIVSAKIALQILISLQIKHSEI